ncbi:hypothetical protein HMPREF1544_10976 [Mucor circinelloides 1006PhL]|uniref:Uncharacterized protein n=1 Tax=Mucor circinelloides f. circinelloides (strain 1006PhL) TaxID=1220926 RepID=S2IX31_MUCC1|nr:hypothetical protein HMPREF1544_10976 [Mucor circinelloides 1006PhL]
MNDRSSAIDIPTTKTTHVFATTTPDGHTMVSSTVTDDHGQPLRRNSLTFTESGISPTYYTSGGNMVQTSHKEDAHNVGSPVYGDSSRIFFPHNSACSCLGSGVGCDCTKTCSC